MYTGAAVKGLETDGDGNVYACVRGGVQVLAPDGERLELIELPEPANGIAWGDDGLYVAATTSIYRVRSTP